MNTMHNECLNYDTHTQWLIGIDEAGRGPLAGPVYVCAFAVPRHFAMDRISYVRDSKQLSPKRRVQYYSQLQETEHVRYGVGSASAAFIDSFGIVRGIRQALARALRSLSLDPELCEVLLDGGLTAPLVYTKQKTLIRGDATEQVISAASIIAKVTRDKWMVRLSRSYPEYKFEVNKGYGTREHRENIQKYGITPQHRATFCRNCYT